ncbi:hypothetical protein VQ574_21270 (plasmid) [Stutzerimonas frequens]|uniref:hypothetical protein n=1 Tax=Stutzerimonas frequens TaxID=2968969 RepID=UPI002DB6D35C|nr:hypothetical protein [Stutzerimonas frequens]WRW29257.1 hypothetical protein VQ574_21270 [Stutzerimonas frequens]
MAIILVLAIGFITFSAMNMAIAPIESSFEQYRTEILRHDMSVIVEAMDSNLAENPLNGYISPSALASTSGNEYLRFSEPGRFQHQVATSLSDGVWRFDRAAVWFESPHSYLGNTNYVSSSNNDCGAGAFTSGGEWCGRSESLWAKLENKRSYSDILLGEKQRLYRTIRKFYQRYSKDQSFSSLGNGQVRSLASLVGYSGTAANCVGVFTYNEIPFGCEDLFNYWGVPVVLNKVTANHIVLVNRTLIQSAAGQVIRLAEEARLE